MNDTTKEALKIDELQMSKSDVVNMIKGLQKRSKRGKQNIWTTTYRATLKGLRVTMELIPEKIVKMMWGDILKFFSALITYNTMVKEEIELGDESPLKKTFSKLKQDVMDGNF